MVVGWRDCGLRCHPKLDKSYQHQGLAWCAMIRENPREYFSQTRDSFATFLLAKLLPLIPQNRGSASDCYEEALKLLGDPEESRGGLLAWTDGDSNAEETTIRPAMEARGQGEDEQTVRPGSGGQLGTVEHYIIDLPRHRSGPLPLNEDRVFLQVPARELLKRMANPYPDNSFFVGSKFEGVGADLDPGLAESSSMSGASQESSDQVEVEGTEPSLTSQDSPEAPQGSPLGYDDGGEFSSGDVSAKMLALREAMQNWDEKADIPIETTELSQIWNDPQPDESQVEPPQSPTDVQPPHRKRTWHEAHDGQPKVPVMPSQLDGNHRASQGPVGKRMKNDEVLEGSVSEGG